MGEKEKSGHQIYEKLQQNKFYVKELIVLQESETIDWLVNVEVLIVNIGKVQFEYDDFLSELFENDLTIIINEAELTNKLTGVERQSWERHLLNKIDPIYSVLPDKSVLKDGISNLIDFESLGIEQTWILAASIGGPEAVQKFLNCFDGSKPILFIIIQHIDNQFLQGMAKQLNQNSQLNITVPISGVKLKIGDCLLHPTEEYLHFGQDGRVELKIVTTESKFTPCIDDCTDRLVKNIKAVNMAVFSGMSSDGVMATKLVKESGGRIIAQTEETCVLSTIVSGTKKTVDIDFEGSPLEMAKYIIDKC